MRCWCSELLHSPRTLGFLCYLVEAPDIGKMVQQINRSMHHLRYDLAGRDILRKEMDLDLQDLDTPLEATARRHWTWRPLPGSGCRLTLVKKLVIVC